MNEPTSTDVEAPPAADASHEAPLPPPPPPRRRGRTLLRLFGIVALVAFGLGLVGAIVEEGSRSGDIVFSEDFESEDIGFSTDSDRTIDLRASDGVYRIEVREPNAPSFMRHVFTHTYDGLSIEATIVHPDDVGRDAIAAIGCWAGRSSYMLGTSPMGDVVLIETIDESTGERRDLTETFVVSDARPAGQPNRLRLDGVGGGRDATIVSPI